MKFERSTEINMGMMYGFDNLQLFSVKRFDDLTTSEEGETTLETTTTSMTSTTTALSTSTKPVNRVIYFCDFDDFEDDGQCEDAQLSSTNIELFGALKYVFIRDTPFYLTDVTSISKKTSHFN